MNSEGWESLAVSYGVGDGVIGFWRMEMQRTHFPSTILGSRNRNVYDSCGEQEDPIEMDMRCSLFNFVAFGC